MSLVIVSYPAKAYMEGRGRQPKASKFASLGDAVVADAVGVESIGSGMGFGMRDLEFDGADITEDEARKRLEAARLPFCTKVVTVGDV